LELKADESANTLDGQNSTQKPQALHRSTTIETDPRAMLSPYDYDTNIVLCALTNTL
jgi:hypothetical protein